MIGEFLCTIGTDWLPIGIHLQANKFPYVGKIKDLLQAFSTRHINPTQLYEVSTWQSQWFSQQIIYTSMDKSQLCSKKPITIYVEGDA